MPVAVPHEPDDARRDASVQVDDRDARVVGLDGEARRDADPDACSDESLHGSVVVGAEHEVRRHVPTAVSCDSTCSIALHWLKPTSGWSAISFSVGVRVSDASGEPAGTTSTYGSRRSSSVSYGPPPTGSVQNVRSSSPRSIISRSSASSCDSRSTTSTLWMGLGEAPEERGDDLRADALERADPEPTRIARLERAHVGLRGEQSRLDRVRVTQQDGAGLGERDGTWPARPLDQAQPDDPLERRDLLRDGRLRVAELLGGAPERALVRDRLERDEVSQVEPEPAISFHDRMVHLHQRLLIGAIPAGGATLSPWRHSTSVACAFAPARCAASGSTSSSSRSCWAVSATRPSAGTIPVDLEMSQPGSATMIDLRVDARLIGAVHALPRPRRGRRRRGGSGVPRPGRPPAETTSGRTTSSTDQLQVGAWARDAIALEIPEQILCRADCAGLCPVCGKDLNVEPHEHVDRELDPRWAALADLKESL